MNFLSLIPGFSWLRLTLVALALVALAGLAWKWRHDAVVEAVAEERAVWVADLNRRVAAQLLQEQANRQKEADLNATIVKQRAEHAKYKERRAATDALVSDSVRQYNETFASQSSQAGTDTAAGRRIDDARASIASECPSAVGEMDKDSRRSREKIALLQSYVTDVCLK